MIRIPSTEPSTWGAEFKVGDEVLVRIDFANTVDTQKVFKIVSVETYREAQRPENPSGKLYILSDSGGGWEGKDLELAKETEITKRTTDTSVFDKSASKVSPSPKAEKSILIQLGLSKSQIKQLPKSIVDEAAVIDGVRSIVSSMPEGVRKDIMQQSIVEAIDIFKNNLLQQEEVELTEEQKKEIEDYKSEEQEEREQRGDTGEEQEPKEGGEEEPVEDKQPKSDDETEEGEDRQPKEGGEEEEPKEDDTRRRRDDDDDDGTGSSGKGKDQGGEDLPKSKGGSGGGGGGGDTPPLDIPDDEYPIPDLTEGQIQYLEDKFFKNPAYARKPDYRETRWDKYNLTFFNLSLEEFLYVYGLFSQVSSIDYKGIDEPNFFSLIKYLWEWNKGYKAKVLDRYYIYTQYVPFLMFVAASPHTHTGNFYDNEVWGYDANQGRSINKKLMFSIPNYTAILYSRGYYAGSVDEEDYKHFASAGLSIDIRKPLLEKNYERLRKILLTTTSTSNDALFYTNNYKGNRIVFVNRIATDYSVDYYIERYGSDVYKSLPIIDNSVRGKIKLDDVGELVVKEQPSAIYDYEMAYGGDKWFFPLSLESTYRLFAIISKFEYASGWVNNPYDVYFKSNVDGNEHILNATSVYNVLNKYLSLNLDLFTISISDVDSSSMIIHGERGNFSMEIPKEFQSFGVLEMRDAYRLQVKFPFPYITNSLEWVKAGAIKIKTEPKTEPVKKTRKKKEYTAEQQEIVDEINALKQALKYSSGEDAESIKQEIEALKQSLKYL